MIPDYSHKHPSRVRHQHDWSRNSGLHFQDALNTTVLGSYANIAHQIEKKEPTELLKPTEVPWEFMFCYQKCPSPVRNHQQSMLGMKD